MDDLRGSLSKLSSSSDRWDFLDIFDNWRCSVGRGNTKGIKIIFVMGDIIQSKPTDNIARPDVYKCLITSSQRISADCPKTTDDIASAEMRKHCIGRNHDKCMGPDIGVIVWAHQSLILSRLMA